jgi:catechol 2,3-dioxygenase-like lactoylglutathione lyase family enzyme
VAIDHVSLATHDMGGTRAFYEGKLGFRVVIHETLAISEGGSVDHIFFDTGESACLAFMKWNGVNGVSDNFDAGINRGLGVPPGTFHIALRCHSLEALEAKRNELLGKGVAVGEILLLHPYRSFFFDDPVNGLRLEYTTRIADYTEEDQNPEKRILSMSIRLFHDAGRHERDSSTKI